jgi:hypothetical protein
VTLGVADIDGIVVQSTTSTIIPFTFTCTAQVLDPLVNKNQPLEPIVGAQLVDNPKLV